MFGYDDSKSILTLFLIKIYSNINNYYKTRHNISLVQKSIVSSYIYQILLFGIIMALSNKLLLSTNIFFIVLDFTFKNYYNNYVIDKT